MKYIKIITKQLIQLTTLHITLLFAILTLSLIQLPEVHKAIIDNTKISFTDFNQ